MKWIKRLGIGLVLVVLLLAVAAYAAYRYKKPVYEGKVKLEALQKDVEVYFDEYGIPHIYAQSEQDAQFALGYVHAQDRLFQMELLRRLGRGELSDMLGPNLVKTDRFFRTIGIMESAKRAAAAFDKIPDQNPMKQAALAYLDGVNAYQEQGDTPLEFQILGIEKRPFTIEDVYATFGYMAFSFAQAFRTDPLITRIYSKYGDEYLRDLDVHWSPKALCIPVWDEKKGSNLKTDSLTLTQDSMALSAAFTIDRLFESMPVAPWIGSNSWVLGPSKAKHGKVLFSNDTHMGFAQPAVWYEAHIECPGLSLYGNYLAGIPFAITGHNRYMAIGLTMMENDDIDFYVEKLNPDKPDQVWFKDHWEDLQVRQETIQVKDGESVSFQVKTSRHGPLINEAIDHVAKTAGQPVSMWWVFNEFLARNLESSYQLLRAQSMQEAKNAVSMGHAPGLNVMYGDMDGNIAWWTMGKLAVRPPHVNSKLFLDGANGNDEILGYVDFNDNPHAENPPSGYVYSANNQPDTTAGILHPGYYIPQDRAMRIVEILDAADQWDINDMKKMVTDVRSPVMPKVIADFFEALGEETKTFKGNRLQAYDILREWNGENQSYDVAPTIYTKIIYLISEKTFQDELGEEDFQVLLQTHMFKRTIPFIIGNDNSLWWDDLSTEDIKESRKDIFSAVFEQAITDLEAQLGSDILEWKWEKIHTIEHGHALGQEETLRPFFNVGPFPVKGNTEVLNNLMFKLNAEGKYEVSSGPAKRRVIDFSDIEHSYSILPTGQSGNVTSDHYDDQAEMYVNGEFRLQKMNRAEIQSKGSQKLLLKAK